MSDLHEFGSSEWLQALFQRIRELAEASPKELAGIGSYSMCEVFTDVPPHLDRHGSRRIAWHLRIHNGVLECGEGEIEAASRRITGDYASLLPLARLELGDDPDVARVRAQQVIGDLLARGRIRIEAHTQLRPAFLDPLHDDMARRTA